MEKEKVAVAYLGELYSYHYLAALKHFGIQNDFISSNSFDELINKVANAECNYGIIAVENSLAGFVEDQLAQKTNIQRIIESKLAVIAELFFPIHLQLVALKNLPLEEIDTIYTHHVAKEEASVFLESIGEKHFEITQSTSSGIKIISEAKLYKAAAIGNKEAALHYGLQIIKENIDNHHQNITRFFVISLNAVHDENTTKLHNKTSLLISHSDKSMLDKKEAIKVHGYEWMYDEIIWKTKSEKNKQMSRLNDMFEEVKELWTFQESAI